MVDPPFHAKETLSRDLEGCDSARCRYWRAFLNFRQSHRNGPKLAESDQYQALSSGSILRCRSCFALYWHLSDGCTENSHVNVIVAEKITIPLTKFSAKSPGTSIDAGLCLIHSAKPRRISSRLAGASGNRKSGIVFGFRRGRRRNSTGHSATRLGYFGKMQALLRRLQRSCNSHPLPRVGCARSGWHQTLYSRTSSHT